MTVPMTTHNDDEDSSLARVARLHPTLNLGAFTDVSPASDETTCLIDLSGERPDIFTYGRVRQQIVHAVGAFRALGIAPGDRLALCLPNSVPFAICFLALMRIGAIPVLANPQMNRDTLRFVLEDARCKGVLTDTSIFSTLRRVAQQKKLEILIATGPAPGGWHDLGDLLHRAEPDASICQMAFDDQAFQPYTAGSTGMPKGIVLTHGGMLWGIEHSQKYWPADAAERGVIAAPMFHKNALRGTLKPMLRSGASVVILPRFEARSYLAALANYQVTGCAGVPAMFAAILEHEEFLKTLDLSSLKTVSLGSSTVPNKLLRKLRQVFPCASVKESYGLTEGGGPLRPPVGGAASPIGSVGIQAPEVEVKLIGKQGPSDQGELWIRSPYVAKAYANRPELTRERIVDGWLRTGDLMRVDKNGFFYFLGRTDDMFVCGGENIYPKEVESLLVAHPDVSDAAVVPMVHVTKGFAPAAIVVPHAGRRVNPKELQDFCAREGPRYAIPRVVLVMQKIPLTVAGKPDRAVVQKMLEESFGSVLAAGGHNPGKHDLPSRDQS